MAEHSKDPPEKKATSDFQLCIVCQLQNKDKLVDTAYRSFRDTAYDKLLQSVDKKATLGNPEYVRVSQRLHGISSEDLKALGASWHSSCYKKVISHVDRDEKRSELAQSSKSSDVFFRRKGRPSTPSHESSLHDSDQSESRKPITRTRVTAF